MNLKWIIGIGAAIVGLFALKKSKKEKQSTRQALGEPDTGNEPEASVKYEAGEREKNIVASKQPSFNPSSCKNDDTDKNVSGNPKRDKPDKMRESESSVRDGASGHENSKQSNKEEQR